MVSYGVSWCPTRSLQKDLLRHHGTLRSTRKQSRGLYGVPWCPGRSFSKDLLGAFLTLYSPVKKNWVFWCPMVPQKIFCKRSSGIPGNTEISLKKYRCFLVSNGVHEDLLEKIFLDPKEHQNIPKKYRCFLVSNGVQEDLFQKIFQDLP
jgi:hypothetical protein